MIIFSLNWLLPWSGVQRQILNGEVFIKRVLLTLNVHWLCNIFCAKLCAVAKDVNGSRCSICVHDDSGHISLVCDNAMAYIIQR